MHTDKPTDRQIPAEYEKFYRRFKDPTKELHDAFGPWAKDQADREPALQPIEYNLDKYPDQWIYQPKVNARDFNPDLPDFLYYAGLNLKMSRSLGFIACQHLLHQLRHQPTSSSDDTPLIERLNENQANGKNTLIITSHFTFTELGYFKAIRSIAKKDRHHINQNGMLMNKLMSRQSYKDKPISKHFETLGSTYYSCPNSTSAEKYNIPKNGMMLGNALFKKALDADLQAGGLELDAALTGKQIIPIRDEQGIITHYEIPPVYLSSANLTEGFDYVVGATMINSPLNKKWQLEVGELIDVQDQLKYQTTAELVDSIYENIATSVERITGKEVIYHKIGHKVMADYSGEPTIN